MKLDGLSDSCYAVLNPKFSVWFLPNFWLLTKQTSKEVVGDFKMFTGGFEGAARGGAYNIVTNIPAQYFHPIFPPILI